MMALDEPDYGQLKSFVSSADGGQLEKTNLAKVSRVQCSVSTKTHTTLFVPVIKMTHNSVIQYCQTNRIVEAELTGGQLGRIATAISIQCNNSADGKQLGSNYLAEVLSVQSTMSSNSARPLGFESEMAVKHLSIINIDRAVNVQ